MMRSALIRIGSLGVICLLTLGAEVEAQSQPVDFSLRLRSDLSDRLAGDPVWLQSSGGATSYLVSTNFRGRTPFREFNASEVLDLTFGEIVAPGGMTIGQRINYDLPLYDPNLDFHSVVLDVSQPIAVRTFIGSGGGPIEPVNHGRWGIYPVDSADNYNFYADVGLLLTGNEIQALANYNQVPFPQGNHSLGAVLRTRQRSIESSGLILRLDCSGHGFSSAPGVTPIFLTSNPSALSTSDLHAITIHWESEQAFIWLAGTLGDGDNVLLLSQSGVGGFSIPILTDPTAFPASDSNDDDDGVGDCNPKPPKPPANPPDSCTPKAPKYTPFCPSTELQTLCSTETQAVSARRCGSTGDGGSSKVTREWSISVSVKIEVGGKEIEKTGNFKDQTCDTVTTQFGNGAGFGECKKDFKHFTICVTTWRVEGKELVVDISPPNGPFEFPDIDISWDCTFSKNVPTKCETESGVSTTTCNRTGP